MIEVPRMHRGSNAPPIKRRAALPGVEECPDDAARLTLNRVEVVP